MLGPEQDTSLRGLAAVVASEDVFAAVAQEVAAMLRPRAVRVIRSERDGTATVVGTWGASPAEPDVDAPILVGGERWGAIAIAMPEGSPLPDGAAEWLAEMAELVATAIANRTTRERAARLADEQAALRRVATLVARGAPPAEVFDAVAEELGQLLEVGSSGVVRFEDDRWARVVAGWGRLGEIASIGVRLPLGGRNVITEIARTGKPARLDDVARTGSGSIADRARRLSTGTTIGGPIVVAGRLWGAMVAAALEGGSLPPDAEPRLEQFVELVGTAIANAEVRVELAQLADEQTALRRVATLVAEEAPVGEVFARVGEEVAGVLGSGVESAVLRYEDDETATVVAGSSPLVPGGIVVGQRLDLDGGSVTARVYRERRAVRVDDYATADGDIAEHASKHEITGAIGCPIVVKGGLWGAMVVAHREPEPFPANAEQRVSQFTELVATAVANAQARDDLRRLAEEQAALRRVATLVAQAAPPPEVFDAVIVEVAQLLGADLVAMVRAESMDEVTVVANRGHDPALIKAGQRLKVDGDSVIARVLRTGRSARMDLSQGHGYIAGIARQVLANGGQTVGAPVTVDGRVWGSMNVTWAGQNRPPVDVEERLVGFAQLLGTAIANADGRDQLTASRSRVLTAGDEARRRVVRDLHDGAQQRLVHTIVTLKLAQRALAQGTDRLPTLLSEALDHAQQGNTELRELAHGILPAVLTRGGLRAGVAAVVSRLDLPVHTDVTSRRLPAEVEASAYFIVAEALTNAVKHAQATQASVIATVDEDRLLVVVRDDGIGGAEPEGHGLLGIGDRVAAFGGRLTIDSPRGGGTVLTAELPLVASGMMG